MRLITEITNEPKQNHRFALPDGTTVSFTLEYRTNQSGWFYSAVYGSIFTAMNRRLVMSPNLLRAFRNVIPFGFACATSDGQEPVFQEDFSSGRAKFYLLDEEDIQRAEDIIHAEV